MRGDVPGLIEGISDGAERIRNIVVNFKDFIRPQSSAMDQQVHLNKIIDAATVIVANLIRKSTNNIEVKLDPELPPVKGNVQKIEQVVINLLTNACQALPGRDRGIRISTSYSSGSVMLQIADDREGITPEVLAHIFDPFFTTRRDDSGTGLGLAISYTIIKEHDGEILVTSQPGKGTTVRIVLPAVVDYRRDVL